MVNLLWLWFLSGRIQKSQNPWLPKTPVTSALVTRNFRVPPPPTVAGSWEVPCHLKQQAPSHNSPVTMVEQRVPTGSYPLQKGQGTLHRSLANTAAVRGSSQLLGHGGNGVLHHGEDDKGTLEPELLTTLQLPSLFPFIMDIFRKRYFRKKGVSHASVNFFLLPMTCPWLLLKVSMTIS